MIILTNVLFIALEILCTYEVFRFMRWFNGNEVRNTRIELLSYIIFFVANLTIPKLIPIPIISLLLTISSFLLLSYNYYSSNRKRLISVFSLYFISLAAETLGLFLGNAISPTFFSRRGGNSMFMYILFVILFCTFTEGLYKIKKLKTQNLYPRIYWFCISMDIAIIAYIWLIAKHEPLQIIWCFIMFGVNYALFWFYEDMTKKVNTKTENLVLIEENKSFKKQIDIMRMFTEHSDRFRHDFKNHIILLEHHIKNAELEEAAEQLEAFKTALTSEKSVKTGVTIVDSILNSKIFEANFRNIKVDEKIIIPKDITYDEFDMTILLGRLMDFAIEKSIHNDSEHIIYLSMIFQIDMENKGWLNINAKHTVTANNNSIEEDQNIIHIIQIAEMYQGTFSYSRNADLIDISIRMLLLEDSKAILS